MRKFNAIFPAMVLVFFASVNAFGARGRSAAAAPARETCEICATLEAQTKTFRALSASSTVDQETGSKMIPKMLLNIRAAVLEMRKNSGARAKILTEAFALAEASGPFDFESQGAQLLFEGIKNDKAANAQFDREYGGTKLTCEQKLLKSSILEFRCEHVKSKGRPRADIDPSCIQKFNYDDCK